MRFLLRWRRVSTICTLDQQGAKISIRPSSCRYQPLPSATGQYMDQQFGQAESYPSGSNSTGLRICVGQWLLSVPRWYNHNTILFPFDRSRSLQICSDPMETTPAKPLGVGCEINIRSHYSGQPGVEIHPPWRFKHSHTHT